MSSTAVRPTPSCASSSIRCSTSVPWLYIFHAVIGSTSRLVRIVSWCRTTTVPSGSSPSPPSITHLTPSIRTPHRSARETSTPGSFVPNQFHNPINPRSHFETTGPEIAEQLGERVDAWVTGVGTTGTFVGVARCLSALHPGVLRVAVEPQGSILGGGPVGHHDVEGIGLSQIWPILDQSLIDEVVTIPDGEAFETCRSLARQEGIFAGGSSGAAAAGALRIARRLGPGKTVVTLFPDGAERYPDQGIFERDRG